MPTHTDAAIRQRIENGQKSLNDAKLHFERLLADSDPLNRAIDRALFDMALERVEVYAESAIRLANQ